MFTTIIDPELGVVRISRRKTSRLSARWDKGRAHLIVPLQCSRERAMMFLEESRAFLLSHRPKVMFELGRHLELDTMIVYFERDTTLRPTSMSVGIAKDGGVVVRVAADVDMEGPQTPGMISRLLMKAARHLAGERLLPEVSAEAARLGLSPRSLKISAGHKVLGHCDKQGNISISAACMFLPRLLRRYIYCHELAHLAEMNHSPRFHALCDSYLQGAEKRLAASLRAYSWPLLI